MPLRLLRMEPASLRASLSTNLRGAAKSRAVNVLDFRSRWLRARVSKSIFNACNPGHAGYTEGMLTGWATLEAPQRHSQDGRAREH